MKGDDLHKILLILKDNSVRNGQLLFILTNILCSLYEDQVDLSGL